VSLFGPGIGECIVVHVGGGDWIIVDSCIDRSSRGPIALKYLRSLGVNVESQVKLVVATHWHDDHIQGLAEILDAAKSARFVNSAAYALKDLMRLVVLGNAMPPTSSATREYDAIVKVLKERRDASERREAVGPIPALANKKILAQTVRTAACSLEVEIYALSPSDGVFNIAHHIAQHELSDAFSAIQHGRRPVVQGPNQLSVVLWLKVGALDVLLGADLEHVAGATEGWRAIVHSRERPSGKASCFKVPHHGSRNADCPESWTELLSAKPIAMLTPHAPSGLPKDADIARLCARTPFVYLTGDPARYGRPRRDNAVEKTLREVTLSRRAVSGRMGHVRLRADAIDSGQEPLVELGNGAQQLCA